VSKFPSPQTRIVVDKPFPTAYEEISSFQWNKLKSLAFKTGPEILPTRDDEISNIYDFASSTKKFVLNIHGEPGTGKSFVVDTVSIRLNSSSDICCLKLDAGNENAFRSKLLEYSSVLCQDMKSDTKGFPRYF